MAINFFTEDITFTLSDKLKRKKWLKEIAQSEAFKVGELNYIFCSDEYLYKINLDYLSHDTYTDIITFDNSEKAKHLEGDIFISVDRVKDNADKHNQPEEQELSRVLSHGLFHLMGYKDKTKEQASLMRNKEEYAIQKYQEM